MSIRATANFDVTGWDETPYDEPTDGPRLARATVRKTFRGDLEGESTADLLMCQADPDDFLAGAGYVASEQVVGSLDGRSGTFVLQHGGVSGGNTEPRTFGHIVPGSGTDALAGLYGTAELSRTADGKHTLTLDYDFLDTPAS
ncbi:MAG TPA: DUF3224 domain-containing protein [Rhodothermales bacterium]|nr:DUF3224 domain-containing protein [Rhodothermales bacterium]